MEYGLAIKEIDRFLVQLSQLFSKPVKVYLLGGSALCYLGSPRRTIDIDFFIVDDSGEFETVVSTAAQNLQLEVEIIIFDEFIPLPKFSEKRHQFIEKYGSIEVYVFDPYSIALSKLARGFDTDIQDVIYLIENRIIDLDFLNQIVQDALPHAWDFDIDPHDIVNYLNVVKQLRGSK